MIPQAEAVRPMFLASDVAALGNQERLVGTLEQISKWPGDAEVWHLGFAKMWVCPGHSDNDGSLSRWYSSGEGPGVVSLGTQPLGSTWARFEGQPDQEWKDIPENGSIRQLMGRGIPTFFWERDPRRRNEPRGRSSVPWALLTNYWLL